VDSADQLGYFKSTNSGRSWTWTRIISDGQAYVPLHYALFQNFGQHDLAVGSDNRVHMVTSGYNYYEYVTDTLRFSFDAVYWNPVTGFKSLVSFNIGDPLLPEIINRRGPSGVVGGNGLGCSYPSLAISENGQYVVATWSQPNWTGTVIDTLADGYVTKSIWYNASFDRGATWIGARRLTPRTPFRKDEFGIMADRLEILPGTPNRVRARLFYLSITTGSMGDGLDPEPMIYREWEIPVTSDVREAGRTIPTSYVLEQNYPNPFNPSTKITYSIPTGVDVKLAVYNTLGQEVASLVDGFREAGTYSADFSSASLSSGIYFYTLKAGQFSETKKMVLMK
jgi:hypothetical protein